MSILLGHSHKGGVRKLLKETDGFSLTELLATMVILALIGMVVATGIPAAQQAYQNVMNASNADVYLSTTAGRLREVLGEADPEDVTAGSGDVLISFTSKKTGRQVSLLNTSNDKPGIYVREIQLDPVDGTPSHEDGPSLLVPQSVGAGAGGVQFVAAVDRIEYADGVFTVSHITVKDAGNPDGASYSELDELVVKPIAAD